MVVSAVSSAQSVARERGIGQELLHLVDAAQDQSRKLTDAVAEGEARLADRDVEDLFEQPDLGELHADDRCRCLARKCRESEGSCARIRAARSTFSPSTSLHSADAESSVARTIGPYAGCSSSSGLRPRLVAS